MLPVRLRFLAGLVVGLALVTCLAHAQVTTATVQGTVKDAQGAVIPGATVTLTSDTRGVQVGETVTDAKGDFIFPGTMPDTYAVTVKLEGFKTKKMSGMAVSPGDRFVVPPITIEVGTLTETVVVTAETQLIQAASGERSFTIPTQSVENLPISSRNFRDLALLTPGVIAGANAGVQRIGGGGYANIMMDGISAMDTGNNGQMIAMNTDAVSEVKVLTSAYQAEYGRSSGIQVLSVTKGGTNQFRGTVYDVERNSAWNQNSWYNKQVGNPKSVSKQRDYGISIGGPIGKPGGNNKLFFFYSHEMRPRTSGNSEQTFRVPTALERTGDFSQSLDNLGNAYPYIRDPLLGLPCSSTNTAGCFKDGGVLGKVPASRLYAPGMALLKLIPVMPNIAQAASTNYNVRQYSPTLKSLSYQPALRVDYQIKSDLRVAFKMNAMNQNSGTPLRYGVLGSQTTAIPGLYDSLGNQGPWITTYSASANYNLGSKTFVEVIYGHTQNFYKDVPTGKLSNRNDAGLAGIPDIYSTNRDVNPDYWMAGALAGMTAPFYVNGRIELPQQVSYGTRSGNTPATSQYPGWLNVNQTWDFAASMTHVRGQHTLKAGFALNHSFKAQNQTQGQAPMGTINFGEDTNNPNDTQFGYANIATGTFLSYGQSSKFIESAIKYIGIEPYVQDNWKVSDKLTIDYGVRFVHLQPEHDTYAGLELLPGSVEGLCRADVVRGRVRQQRRDLHEQAGQEPDHGRPARRRDVGLHRAGGPRHGQHHQRDHPAGQGHLGVQLRVSRPQDGPARRLGLPAEAGWQVGPPRRLRDLLRPRGRQLHDEPVGQPADRREHHDAVRQPPVAGHRGLGEGRAEPRRLPVLEPEPPRLRAVERRHADAAAARVRPRRVVRRPAPVRQPGRAGRPAGHQPEHDRPRVGVPGREPGHHGCRQHRSRGDGRHEQPDALLPGLRQHQPVRGRLLSDDARAAVLAAAPVQQGPLGRLELELDADGPGQLLGRLRGDAAHRAPGGRHRGPARRPEGVGRHDEGPGHAGPHLQGQLRVGHARPARRVDRVEGHRGPRQRLAAVGNLERPDRRRLLDRLLVSEQRRRREPDRVA